MSLSKRERREAAHQELMDLIAAALERGQVIPCVDFTTRSNWTSHRPTERAEAARACQACPLLTQCRLYAAEHEIGGAGVWGGQPVDYARNAARLF